MGITFPLGIRYAGVPASEVKTLLKTKTPASFLTGVQEGNDRLGAAYLPQPRAAMRGAMCLTNCG
jgi:hypothetical protein